MIPDKIYIPKEYTDNDITPIGVTTKLVFPNDVCYIRKDALIEWLEECKNNPIITDLQKDNIQELIDKINSL